VLLGLQDQLRLALAVGHHHRLAAQLGQSPRGVLERRRIRRDHCLALRLRRQSDEALHLQHRARRAAVFERAHHQARIDRGQQRRTGRRPRGQVGALQRESGAVVGERELVATGAIEERRRIGLVAVQPAPAARFASRADTGDTAQHHRLDPPHVGRPEHRVGVADEHQLAIGRDAPAHHVATLGIEARGVDRDRERDR
jgi:hypothetical protein